MSSLFGIFSTAVQALGATQGALNATTENIANVNTPGFSRRRAVLVEEVPEYEAGIAFGRGVRLAGIESVRDEMLELRLHVEAQQHGAAQQKLNSLQPLDAVLSDLDNGLSTRMDAFFNSLNALSAQPSSVPLRQSVLTAASNLANGFNQTSQKLSDMRKNMDYDVTQAVTDINDSINNIARLNSEVVRARSMGGDASTYEDERTAAIRSLSELADVAVVQSDAGLTITTARGTSLVVGGKPYPLQTTTNAEGHVSVIGDGRDVTGEFSGGKLGAILQVRDTDILNAIHGLDDIAFALANATNQAHSAGFDMNGAGGGNFFNVGTTPDGAAVSLALAVSDPYKIAASSNGDAGSNGNLASMMNVRTATLINGQSVSDVLSGLTFRVGSSLADSQAQLQASEAIQSQLQKQRDGISGVSLDEEAANLIRYQRAYQAAARVIDTANQMLDIACNLGR